jgi:hypothetical protein
LARLTLPQGTPTERTLEVVEHLAHVAWKLNEYCSAEPGDDVMLTTLATLAGLLPILLEKSF